MKTIKRPLTTIDNKDFMTWEKVDFSKENEEFAKKSFKKLQEVRDRIRKTCKNGKVFVEGLGRVPAF